MNCPSRADPDVLEKGWNQSPSTLALHKNDELNGRVNLTRQRDHRIPLEQPLKNAPPQDDGRGNGSESGIGLDNMIVERAVEMDGEPTLRPQASRPRSQSLDARRSLERELAGTGPSSSISENEGDTRSRSASKEATCLRPLKRWARPLWRKLVKYARFIGPGFLISVAYIDPGNYATDVAAGASYQYGLLVMILVANCIAIFLQSLAIRLGSVTGLNLAENCKVNCPRWLNYVLWFFGEAAIIATDIAEVLGTAIALNLLIKVPLVAGCAISIVDVLIILAFYRPRGSMRGMRIFESFVIALVLGVAICFSVMLSLIDVTNVGILFRGYLPSRVLVESTGLYQAAGILGATVMPHGLYLGSGLVQPRLQEYDDKHNTLHTVDEEPPTSTISKYRPSLPAIRHCLTISTAELALSLATFALFVNSAILIVAGATLYSPDAAVRAANANASLFDIHALFSRTLAPFAGTVFALALLLSGTSAGIVCTIAGQMISEGQLGWSVKPWVRRLVTRSVSITPSIIVAGAVGRQGVSNALVGTQVALSVILPVTSAPLIWFTCRGRYMTVRDEGSGEAVQMRNGPVARVAAVALWVLLVVMNVALLVLVGLGKA